MECRQLKYFLQIVEAGSFTRAADRIGIAQPALSRQIRALEEEMGTELLIRHGRGVLLTDAGQRFQERAQTIMRQMNRLRDDVQANAIEPTGEITVGVPPSLRRMLTARVITRFANECPKVMLHVIEGISVSLRDAVIIQDVDLAIIISIEPIRNLETTNLFTQPQYLFGAPGSGFSSDRPIKPTNIASLPMLLSGKPNGLRMLFDQYCIKHSIDPDVRMEFNSLELLLDQVSAGVGYTVLPQSVLLDACDRFGLEASPIEDLTVSWLAVNSYDRFQRVAVKRLLSIIKEEVKSVIKEPIWSGAVLDIMQNDS